MVRFRASRRRARATVGVLLAPAALLLIALPLAAQPSQPRPSSGALLPIEGTIDDILRDSLKRRIDAARTDGHRVLIFELNTPGGLVSSALDICRVIKSQPPEIRTVAWVHSQAYSAGAMIALACNEIWMSPSSAIGDAAPIMISPQGVQELGTTERAKAESPILLEFRDSALRNGYSPLLAEAMVTVGAEVWWLERTDGSQRRFVSGDEKRRLIDDTAADQREWRLVETYTIEVDGQPRVMNTHQPVDSAESLLTMSQYDAIGYGFARGLASGPPELAERLGLATVPVRLVPSGWENFATWLNSPIVRGILLILVLVGAWAEFQHPGLILPGVTALVALAIFLAAPYAAGLASVWMFVLVGLGLVLLALEIFLIPGFGFAGLLGAALLIVGLLASFVPTEPGAPPFALPSLQGTWSALVTGLKVMASSIIVSIAGIVLLAQYLPKTRLAGGVVSANPEAAVLVVPDPAARVAQVGDVGIVTGDLRPGGQARFGQEVVDVASQGEYVPAGRRVQVIRREGMNVVVRPLPDEA